MPQKNTSICINFVMVFASYIVHIYRFKKGYPQSLVGVVEEVGVKERKAFTNYDELWNVLVSSKGMMQKRKSGLRSA